MTVIKSSLADELFPNHSCSYAKLRGIGKQDVSAKKFSDINMLIGSQSYAIDTYAAEIEDDLLLGLDFFDKFGVEIDFSRCELRIASETIPAYILMDSEKKQHSVCRVFCSERVRVDPHSIGLVRANTEKEFFDTFVFSPASNASNCMAAATINAPGCTALAFLINDSDNTIILPKGTILGSAIAGEVMKEPKPGVKRIRAFRHAQAKKYQHLPDFLKDLFERSAKNLNEDQKESLKALLIEFQDVFASHDFDLGHFSELQHTIPLLASAVPVKEKIRRTPSKFEGEEEKNLEAMLEAGVIQPSNSPWASAPVLVRKKDGGVRWCLDYRKLNDLTIKDAFPLPLISNMMDTLQGNIFMSSLDLASGYWQIEIAPEDREKTAFITKYGLFEHVRMSMGLCNAPSTFQRAMNLVLRGMTWKTVLAFLDDVLVLGRSFEDHLQNLREVLERFRNHNLKLKPKKCSMFQKETKFLGRIVSGDSVSVDPQSIECVKEWPQPKCTRDVERFLGFANYNREHIPDLAKLAEPLYALTGKAPFHWKEEHTIAFETVKSALLSPIVLSLPTADDAFVLDVDASDTAVAAQLSQIRDGVEFPISYGSKSLTPAQRKYCATRKELLALIVFTRQYRHYLLGRPFVARTDHSSLVWLTHFKDIQGQLARWLEELQQYNIHIVHRKGKDHVNADSLSRIPDDIPYCVCYRAATDVSQLPCGGCAYCKRAQNRWGDFEQDVDDVTSLCIPAIRSVQVDSNWADILSDCFKSEKQDSDADLKLLKQWLITPPSKEQLSAVSQYLKTLWMHRSQLTIDKDIVWYLWIDEEGNKSKKFVTPRNMVELVLKLAHDNSLSGHFGIEKTCERIRRNFYWPNLKQDVEIHVKSCYACNRSKHLRRKYCAPLQEHTTGAPMEQIHIDIMGPLPMSKRGNTCCLVIVCQFTKWVEIVSLPDQQAETIARAMVDNLFSRLGCPRVIFSDQGVNFNSQLFHELCERLGIVKKRTTAYRASSNGQVERINRTLGQSIRTAILESTQQNQDDWDDKIPIIAGAIRSTVNRGTGFTPNKLMLGREVYQPLELVCGVEREEKPVYEYIQQLERDMSDAHITARKALKSGQCRQKRDYDVNIHTTKYKVGDAVLLVNSATKIGQCKKLQPLWLGPFLIVEVISNILYKISGQKRSFVVHHDRLKLCRDRALPFWLVRRRDRQSQNDSMSGRDMLNETLGSFIDDVLYCYCRRPDNGQLMIECDSCGDWFHVRKCLKMTEKKAKRLAMFFCKDCEN